MANVLDIEPVRLEDALSTIDQDVRSDVFLCDPLVLFQLVELDVKSCEVSALSWDDQDTSFFR